MDKFYKHKLYEIKEDGTQFVILAEDFDHHKNYTEYLIRVTKYGGKVNFFSNIYRSYDNKPMSKPFWVRSSQLMGLTLDIIAEGNAVSVLYE